MAKLFEIEVEKVNGYCACGYKVGDIIACEGLNTPKQPFCGGAYAIIFPMQTALFSGATFNFEENPYCKTKLACPDNGYVVFKLTLIKDQEIVNKIILNELETNEINLLSNMINNVFDEFVGKDYSEEGNREFKKYIEPQNILARLNDKSSKFYVAKYNNEIIGTLEIKNKDHISLFFVKKEFHDKNIGEKLFDNFLRILKHDNDEIKTISVNSSFHAEKIYSKLGFIKTDEIQEKNGIKYIPMEYKL